MKRILILSVVSLFATLSFAQQEKGTWTIQPKLGMNVATMTEVDDADPRIGMAAGVGLQYQVSDRFGISFDLLYSMQGCKTDGYISYVKATEVDKMDYINIPILANVYLYKGLALKAGIQPGFNVIDKYKISGGGASVTGNMSDILDIKRFDFSIPIGISYEHSNVVIDARYNFGFTEAFDDTDFNNRVFQLTLGYKFKL